MRLIRGLDGLRTPGKRCVVTVGSYDGLHLGHQALLGRLRERAAASGDASVIVTFEPLPREYLQPKHAAGAPHEPARALADPCADAARLPVPAALR